MPILANLLAGMMFGTGLVVSGLANPAKVQNFLDIAGTFDPSLLFVLGAAVVTTAVGYNLVFRTSKPVFANEFMRPGTRAIDTRLLAGAAIFGIGWGLIGYCPGPAITALPLLNPATVVFVISMLTGMAAARFVATNSPSATTP